AAALGGEGAAADRQPREWADDGNEEDDEGPRQRLRRREPLGRAREQYEGRDRQPDDHNGHRRPGEVGAGGNQRIVLVTHAPNLVVRGRFVSVAALPRSTTGGGRAFRSLSERSETKRG